MSQINAMPPEYGVGLEFNYTNWNPTTVLTFANVPWSSDYRDIVKFERELDLVNYIVSQNGVCYNNSSYAKANEPIRVSLPFNIAYKYNYIMVHNPSQPIDGDMARSFYYFIQDVKYLAPNTTELVLSLDIWQTFGRLVEFGNSYVERGHIGIANEKQFNNNGRDYLTVPEGIDLGNDYTIANTFEKPLVSRLNADNVKPGVVFTSTVNLEMSGGDVNNPSLKTATGSNFEYLPNGMNTYYCDSIGEFHRLMLALSSKPWISSNIVSVMIVPKLPTEDNSVWSHAVNIEGYSPLNGDIYHLDTGRVLNRHIKLAPNFRDISLPSRFKHLHKFKTNPYMIVEITTYSGNPIILKPERISGADIELVQLSHYAQPSPRIAFYPYLYNCKPNTLPTTSTSEIVNDNAEFLDIMVGIFDFPTFSIANNNYLSYMASNRYGIAYNYSAADWSQQKSLRGADTSNANAITSNQAILGQAQIQQDASSRSTEISNQYGGYRAVQSGVNSLATGMSSGNPIGVAGGVLGAANAGIGYAIDVNERNASLANQLNVSQSSSQLSYDIASKINDSNIGMARYAAQGDYANTIAGIEAKVQDAKLLAPSISGQLGGDAFNLTVYKWAVVAKIKTVDSGALENIGNYWLRYGYTIQRFVNVGFVGLHCMSKFTYWKLLESYVRSNAVPEMYLQGIRGIFEKGVTVWVNPNDIGKIDIADNIPLTGIRY